jgi:diguanylate cyclase (GGDEF)-like protein
LVLVEADGAAIRLDGVWRLAGATPRIGSLRRALELLGRRPFVSECIVRERPELAQHLPDVAGLLIVPLGDHEDVLMFFRREAAHEIGWLGDPGLANRRDALSPRTSFSAWIQEVKDRSAPWGTIVQEAADLARELEDALARREATHLAELAMIDALTGLHNRRHLEDRLSVPGPVGPEGKAMLFIDLDAFKDINDAHGHDVGDAVILEVAQRLQAHSREQDDVVRLGGDEFVVVVDGIAGAEIESIAERLIDAIALPIATGAGEVTVTASCGVVIAPPGSPRHGMLEAADAAMYRAKRAGRNRVST